MKITSTKHLFFELKYFQSKISIVFYGYLIWQICIFIARTYFYLGEPKVIKDIQDRYDAYVDPEKNNFYYYYFVNMNTNIFFSQVNTAIVILTYPFYQIGYYKYYKFNHYNLLKNFLLIQIFIYVLFTCSLIAYFGVDSHFICSISGLSITLKSMIIWYNYKLYDWFNNTL